MFTTRSLTAAMAVSLLASCSKKAAEPAESSSTGGESELNAEEATTIVGGIIAREMCKPEGYFASCGTFEAGECEAITVAAARSCIEANPGWLEKLDDDAVTRELGVCTTKGTLLKMAGDGQLSIEGRCSQPEQFP
jgi:hypothetical protein